MAQNDFLRPLFTQPPTLVAVVVLVTGWGSLLLIAWRADAITDTLLRSPGFMIGDLVLLPLAGGLIASCYRKSWTPPHPTHPKILTYSSLVVATLFVLAATHYSLLVSGNYHGIWSVPHTLFIWFIAYVLVHFFFKGAYFLCTRSAPGLRYRYAAVVPAVSGHILLKLIFGSASFETS